MKQFLITVAGVLVGLILFLVIVPVALIGSISASMSKREAAPSGAVVLAVDLRGEISDQPSISPFAFGRRGDSVLEFVQTLDAAGRDSNVKGVYIRANTMGMAPAHAEEIRAAIAAFRQTKKFVIAHIQNDGIRASIAGYAATAGADELWLQDAGEFLPMGITAEETFFADTLRRFHLSAQFETREEFKTAADNITQSGFTPANRESTEALLTSLYDRLIAAVAEDRKARGLNDAAVRAAIEATPFDGETALARKLVDRLGRPEDAEAAALERAGGGAAHFVEIGDYAPKPRSGPVIAVVHGEGPIVTASESGGPFGDDQIMEGDTIAAALGEAAEDKDVKAIVFRVSSPGGSVVASDQIWHAVERARAAGKKVVVSMGAYAASGGYYVSAGADEIIAWPSTITGSIGVVGGKIIIGDAMRHYLSANTDTISVGSPLNNYFTSDRRFSNAEQAAFAGFIDRAYTDFVALVAKGRGLTAEEVRAVAKGRVWTGAQAKERRLVNGFGGFSTAVARAKALAGIDAESAVELKFYPVRPSPFEAIEELFGVSAQSARAAATLAAVLGDERVEDALRAALAEPRGARAEVGVDIR